MGNMCECYPLLVLFAPASLSQKWATVEIILVQSDVHNCVCTFIYKRAVVQRHPSACSNPQGFLFHHLIRSWILDLGSGPQFSSDIFLQ